MYACESEVYRSNRFVSWLDRVWWSVSLGRGLLVGLESRFDVYSAGLDLVCWRVEVFSLGWVSRGCLEFLFLGVQRLVLFQVFTGRCRNFVSRVRTFGLNFQLSLAWILHVVDT